MDISSLPENGTPGGLSSGQIERLILVCEEAFEVVAAIEEASAASISREMRDLLSVTDYLRHAECLPAAGPARPAMGGFHSNLLRICVALGKAASKSIRNGFGGRHPDGGPDNAETLASLIGALHALAGGESAKNFGIPHLDAASFRVTMAGKSRHLHHQGDLVDRYGAS